MRTPTKKMIESVSQETYQNFLKFISKDREIFTRIATVDGDQYGFECWPCLGSPAFLSKGGSWAEALLKTADLFNLKEQAWIQENAPELVGEFDKFGWS